MLTLPETLSGSLPGSSERKRRWPAADRLQTHIIYCRLPGILRPFDELLLPPANPMTLCGQSPVWKETSEPGEACRHYHSRPFPSVADEIDLTASSGHNPATRVIALPAPFCGCGTGHHADEMAKGGKHRSAWMIGSAPGFFVDNCYG